MIVLRAIVALAVIVSAAAAAYGLLVDRSGAQIAITTAALVVLAILTVAASLEAFAGFCLGCWMFARLMRLGVIPEDVCEECNDISRRLAA